MCLFWTQRKIFWRKFVIRLFWGTIDFNSRRKILLCVPHSSEYLPLCSEQTHSYRFGSTWGWIKMIFGCTVPLTRHISSEKIRKSLESDSNNITLIWNDIEDVFLVLLLSFDIFVFSYALAAKSNAFISRRTVCRNMRGTAVDYVTIITFTQPYESGCLNIMICAQSC